MAFGFSKQAQEHILSALQKFPEIERAIIFGSRAMGNFKKASDVDLAIVGRKITPKTAIRLRSQLNEELPLPYFFDVVVYEKIANDKLKQHINEYGIELFPAESQWTEAFKKSQDQLAILADEALAEFDRGETEKLEPDEL